MSQPERRQIVKFTFFKVAPEWRRLPADVRAAGKKAVADVIAQFAEGFVVLRTYSLVGMRGDCDLMLWQVAYSPEEIQRFTAALLATPLGAYFETPYSYLAMTKRSMYVKNHKHEGQEGDRLHIEVGDAKYLFVYPFVKTRPWYKLTKEARQGMMNEHIRIGHKYPSVKLNTTYSFGLDDQEFVLAFETDSPADFLDLVMELRESEASGYTLRDTPIYTCVAGSPEEVLDTLGG